VIERVCCGRPPAPVVPRAGKSREAFSVFSERTRIAAFGKKTQYTRQFSAEKRRMLAEHDKRQQIVMFAKAIEANTGNDR
jgi:hypothetical protein